eukprot:4958718-Prymnesium_polylepis.1
MRRERREREHRVRLRAAVRDERSERRVVEQARQLPRLVAAHAGTDAALVIEQLPAALPVHGASDDGRWSEQHVALALHG